MSALKPWYCLLALSLGTLISSPANAQTTVEETDAIVDIATMSLSDLAAFFESLTEDMTGPLGSHVREEVSAAAEAYESGRIFSGSDEEGAITWEGEVNYYPFVAFFTATLTVSLNDYQPDPAGLVLNGEADFYIAGFWNPVYHGLTSLGFPYFTNFTFDGELNASGLVEGSMSVYINIDGTQSPVLVEFRVNDYDVIEALLDAESPSDEEEGGPTEPPVTPAEPEEPAAPPAAPADPDVDDVTVETTEMDCAAGDCVMACPAGSSCNLSCAGGNCEQTCGAGATCNFSCSGGACLQTCLSDSDCNLSCSGGDCFRSLDASALADTTCSGGACYMEE